VTAAALAVLQSGLDAATAASLESCVRCGLCAESCHVYLTDHESASMPAAKVARVARLYRRYHTWAGRMLPRLTGAGELDERGLVELAEAAFGRCTMCGRCTLNCAVGLDPAAVIGLARAMAAAAGMVPAGIQANVTAALETGNSMRIPADEVRETMRWLEDDLKATTGDPTIALPVDRAGARVLYALNPREIKFFPLSISAAAQVFHAARESWTLTSTDFDITNYGYFANDRKAARSISERLLRRAEELGVAQLIVAECGHGYRSLRWEAPEWLQRTQPFEIRSFVELLDEYVAEGRIALDPGRNPERVTLHDPCNLVRNGGVIEPQRRVLRRAARDFVEMTPNRERNYCCGGGGGLLAASEYAPRRIAIGGLKADQIRRTGARVVVSPCHNCIDQLMELNKHYALDVEVRTLAEVVADALVPPAPVQTRLPAIP
jgi:Fe-S oxidoreductase